MLHGDEYGRRVRCRTDRRVLAVGRLGFSWRARRGGRDFMTDSRAQIADGPPVRDVGAFFDLDGTLVDGFHRRRRTLGIESGTGRPGWANCSGTVEAAVRYRFGRMEVRPPAACGPRDICAVNLLTELEDLGEYPVPPAHPASACTGHGRYRAWRIRTARAHRGAEFVGDDDSRRAGRPGAGHSSTSSATTSNSTAAAG